MPDYTLKNFNEVNDIAAESGGKLEARFARGAIESDHLGVSYLKYSPGHKMQFGHHHREQEEAYVVISGSGRVKLGDEVLEVKQWDVLRVAPQVVRQFEGVPDGLEMIAIGNDRPEGGDGERVPGFWDD
jgi:mannose-6-phosphate isomerase-like protein (cupin superfamily)